MQTRVNERKKDVNNKGQILIITTKLEDSGGYIIYYFVWTHGTIV